MVTSLPGSSIVSSTGRAALLDSFRKRIASRMTFCKTEESLELLLSLQALLLAEKESTGATSAEFVSLAAAIDAATAADQFIPLGARYMDLLAAQFLIRPSSATLYGISQIYFDHALSRLLDITSAGAAKSGALFVSGELGRRESLYGRRSSIIFIYPDSSNGEPPAKASALALEQSLTTIFPFISTAPGQGSSWFWSGSLSEWRGLASAALASGHHEKISHFLGFSGIIATLTDARFVCGNSHLAASITGSNRAIIAKALAGDNFRSFARDVSSMPVALGIFGRLKTVKSGRQRGMLPLTEQAINPLVDAVRAFATTFALTETSTDGRIKALLSRGAIGVALGEKLVAAWQMLTREMVRIELKDSSADALFLDINALDDDAKEQLKAALDELTTFQRLLYQQMSEESP